MSHIDELIADATRLRDQGLGAQAAKKYEEAAALRLDEGNLYGAAECWHMAGVSLKHQQELAERAFESAIGLYEQANSVIGVGRVYRDRAIAYAYRHQDEEALVWLRKSQQVLEQTDARAELGITIAKIGHLLAHRGEYGEAERELKRALELIQAEGHAFYEATTLMHLAKLELARRNYELVVAHVEKAFEALARERPELDCEALREHFGRRSAQLCGLLAQGYLGLGRADEATDQFELCLKYTRPMDDDAAKVVYEDVQAAEFLQVLRRNHSERYEQLVTNDESRRVERLA